MIAHTYPFSIQFLHQIGDSFRLSRHQPVCRIWLEWRFLWAWHTLHVISNWSCHRRRNNEHPFLKVASAEPAVASWLSLHSVHGSQPVAQTSLVLEGIIAYSIHWQAYLHNYMRHNTLFYTFNKDNIEHVIKVKQGHGECLASMFVKDDVTFRSFPKILD